MKRILATIAITTLAALALTGCLPAVVTDPNNPTQVEDNGSYVTEYVNVGDDQIVACLWYQQSWKSAAMDCNWDYDSANHHQGEVTELGYGYEIEYLQIDGENVKCLWYNRGQYNGSLSCDR